MIVSTVLGLKGLFVNILDWSRGWNKWEIQSKPAKFDGQMGEMDGFIQWSSKKVIKLVMKSYMWSDTGLVIQSNGNRDWLKLLRKESLEMSVQRSHSLSLIFSYLNFFMYFFIVDKKQINSNKKNCDLVK